MVHGLNCGVVQRDVGRRERREDLTVLVFHKFIHRYFVNTQINALTSVKRLFKLTHVDG
jgi:hypothetical protein